ncbi:MAG: hypothetical protein ABFD64_11820 [Armatimonadota bacterium]
MIHWLLNVYDQIDITLTRFMRRWGTDILRISVSIVFIWFGVLKLVGESPVNDLVARTVYWIAPDIFVPVLGVWEVLIGTLLLLKLWMRLTLLLMWAQLAGTFLVLLVRPETAFQHGNPLLLTIDGEFVVKNLVIIAAGIVFGGAFVRRDTQEENGGYR